MIAHSCVYWLAVPLSRVSLIMRLCNTNQTNAGWCSHLYRHASDCQTSSHLSIATWITVSFYFMLREHFTMIWMNKESMNRSLGNLWMQVIRMLDTQVDLTEDFLSERCCAFLRFAKFCGNLGLKSFRKTSNCVAYGAKQVVPLSLQNKFCSHKGHLPIAAQRSDVHRCFASRNRCPGIRTTKVMEYEEPAYQSISVAAYSGRTVQPEGKSRSLPVREQLYP